MGPFSETRLARIESSVSSGSARPVRENAPAPMSRRSHSIDTPVASTTRRAASITSGPMPSPGMSVTRWATNGVLPASSTRWGLWSVAGPPTILSEARRLDAGLRRALGAPRPKDVASVTEKGLREVVAADTTVSDIDGEEGRLWYVGYE